VIKGLQNTQPLRLSLLLPIYNVAPYLAECIESIVSQNTDARYEIVLLDDCSTDGSRQIAERFCKQHPNYIRLLYHSENAGISVVRNDLVEAARGEYIWFIDPDDKLFPFALNKLFGVLSQHAPDMVLCDFSKDNGPQIAGFFGPSGTLQHDTQALVCGIFAARKMHCWSKIFKRALWGDDLCFPEGRIFEDIACIPYLTLRARNYFYAREKWIFYRQRRNSIIELVSRAKGFDESGQNNLASALTGFKEAMHAQLGNVAPETNFAVAHFIARSFTQIGFKLVREKLFRQKWSETRRLMQVYRAQTEAASPLTFAQLADEYRKKRIYLRLIVLQIFCRIAGPCPLPTLPHGLNPVEPIVAVTCNDAKIPNFIVEPQGKTR
jgi:glycosyltransferase involved in cell wall biosynthesis